jgi:hypothetical protein
MTQGWTEGVAETTSEAGDVRRTYFQHAPVSARPLNEIDARDAPRPTAALACGEDVGCSRRDEGLTAVFGDPSCECFEDHLEPDFELVAEVVAGLENVFGGHLKEVGVVGGGELPQHWLGNFG